MDKNANYNVVNGLRRSSRQCGSKSSSRASSIGIGSRESSIAPDMKDLPTAVRRRTSKKIESPVHHKNTDFGKTMPRTKVSRTGKSTVPSKLVRDSSADMPSSRESSVVLDALDVGSMRADDSVKDCNIRDNNDNTVTRSGRSSKTTLRYSPTHSSSSRRSSVARDTTMGPPSVPSTVKVEKRTPARATRKNRLPTIREQSCNWAFDNSLFDAELSDDMDELEIGKKVAVKNSNGIKVEDDAGDRAGSSRLMRIVDKLSFVDGMSDDTSELDLGSKVPARRSTKNSVGEKRKSRGNSHAMRILDKSESGDELGEDMREISIGKKVVVKRSNNKQVGEIDKSLFDNGLSDDNCELDNVKKFAVDKIEDNRVKDVAGSSLVTRKKRVKVSKRAVDTSLVSLASDALNDESIDSKFDDLAIADIQSNDECNTVKNEEDDETIGNIEDADLLVGKTKEEIAKISRQKTNAKYRAKKLAADPDFFKKYRFNEKDCFNEEMFALSTFTEDEMEDFDSRRKFRSHIDSRIMLPDIDNVDTSGFGIPGEQLEFDVMEALRDISIRRALNKIRKNIIPVADRDYTKIANAVPKQFDMGQTQECPHCHALNYTQGCCSDGKVLIPLPVEHPTYIYRLLCEDDEISKHFQTHIVRYNSLMAMASLQYDGGEREKNGAPFAKVQGEMYHVFGSDQETLGERPCFMQIYKYGVSEASRFRRMDGISGTNTKTVIIRNLTAILQVVNFHARRYRLAREIMEKDPDSASKNITILLRQPNEVAHGTPHHPGTMHQPIRKDMPSMLFNEQLDGGPGKPSAWIESNRTGKLHCLHFYNALIEPLSYPIIFPYGNTGFYRGEYLLGVDYRCADDSTIPDYVGREMVEDPLPIICDDEMEDTDGMFVNYTNALKKYISLKLRGYEDLREDEDFGEERDFVFPGSSVKKGELPNPIVDSTVVGVVGAEESNSDVGVGHDAMNVYFDEEQPHIDIFSDSGTNGRDDCLPSVVDGEESNSAAKLLKSSNLQLNRGVNASDTTKLLSLDKTVKARSERLKRLKYFKELCFDLPMSKVDLIFETSELNMFLSEKLLYFHTLSMEYMQRLEYAFEVCCKGSVHLEELTELLDEGHKLAIDRLDDMIDQELDMILSDSEYRSSDAVAVRIREEHGVTDEYTLPDSLDDEEYADLIQVDVDIATTCETRFKKSTGKQTRVSRRQYANHQMQVRDINYHPIISCQQLGQLYLIDCALRIIRERHDNDRAQMIEFQCSTKDAVQKFNANYVRHAAAAEKKGLMLGYYYRINKNMAGCTGWYKERYQQSMAVIDVTGKPDLFITMTGNPAWREITDNVVKGTDWHSNALLVNEVFYWKMQNMLDDIVEKELFGPVVSFCYSIEFQKRGMPHCHLLVTLKDGHKMDTPDAINSAIWAVIPPRPLDKNDPDYDVKLRFHNNVVDKMIHTPCEGIPGAYCQQKVEKGTVTTTRCTKNFPYDFSDSTSTTGAGKVRYRRPDDGVYVEKKITISEEGRKKRTETVHADNRYVVPYNPYLLNKYGCHINVEAVTNIDVIKYVYKYIYKGYDRALVNFVETFDITACANSDDSGGMEVHKMDGGGAVMLPKGLRVKNFQIKALQHRMKDVMRKNKIDIPENGQITAFDEALTTECFREITPNEAAWTVQGYPLAGNSHIVKSIRVHADKDAPVAWAAGKHESKLDKVANDQFRSEFEAWFELNKSGDTIARQLKYVEIPLFYNFCKTTCKWIRYSSRPHRIVVLLHAVSPRNLETFAIRLLAQHQRGSTSFEHLRTVGGVVHPTAIEAAHALSLMNSSVEWNLCLLEASKIAFPIQMRRLFVDILVFGECLDPAELFEAFVQDFAQVRRDKKEDVTLTDRAVALYHIRELLELHNQRMDTFGLPEPDMTLVSAEIKKELAIVANRRVDPDHEAEGLKLRSTLTEQQGVVCTEILNAVENMFRPSSKRLFFLQASGGCGKTYLYRAIYHTLMARRYKVSMVATTGIAATLLVDGTTAHKKFLLPLDLEAGTESKLGMETMLAQELRDTHVFIIDEATMLNKYGYRAIDRLLRHVQTNVKLQNCPFGGKVILLGGDWKQLLPVAPGLSQTAALQYALKCDAEMWSKFKVLTLDQNMRAKSDPSYSKLLENIGNGKINGELRSHIILPHSNLSKSVDDVIKFIYDGIIEKPQEVAKCCVLATLNEETTKINNEVLSSLPGEEYTYTAYDIPIAGNGMNTPNEYTKKMMPSGMAPHTLKLKKGSVVILLRNLSVREGKCNGSRMVVKECHPHLIICELLTTEFRGHPVFIPRVKMDTKDAGKKNDNVKFSRLQFPLRLAYCLTINKSQGQTFNKVGVVLNNNVFSHGQLYVAMSRVRQSSNIRIFSSSSMPFNDQRIVVVHNIVTSSILRGVNEGNLYDPSYREPEATIAETFTIKKRVVQKKAKSRKELMRRVQPITMVE